MKTARLKFPLMLALTSSCSTMFERSAAAHSTVELAGQQATWTPAACVVAGEPRTLAPTARIRSGIDLVSTANELALGFSTASHQSVAMKLDPSSGEATSSQTGTSDCKTGHLSGAVRVSASVPFTVGVADGALAWGPCAGEEPTVLWPLPDGTIEDLRGIALHDGGFAILFRQRDSVWLGRLDSDKNPVGSLSRIAERPQLRWPTLAESGGSILVVWADRSNGGDRSALGGAVVAPSGTVKPIRLDLPAGGLGGDAIQPALAVIDAAHYLLVWTEGPAWSHEVRAVTIESNGHAVGAALRVSPGVESGWGRVAVTADGRGAIVYLVPAGGGLAVAATPIVCRVPEAPSTHVTTTRL